MVLVDPAVVVIEEGLADTEKSGDTLGENAGIPFGEICGDDEDLADAGLAAETSIRNDRQNSTRIFQCLTTFRDLGVR